jgi:hypothetical protein
LATLPTLDESGLAVRQTGGRDPHRGIRISDVPAGGPQPAAAAPIAPAMAPSAPVVAPRPLDKGKGAASSSFTLGGIGGRRKRGDADCAAPTGHLFRTPQKCQRTVVGAEGAGSQA